MLCSLIIHSDVKFNVSPCGPLQLCALRKSHQNEDVIQALKQLDSAYMLSELLGGQSPPILIFSEHLNEKIDFFYQGYALYIQHLVSKTH